MTVDERFNVRGKVAVVGRKEREAIMISERDRIKAFRNLMQEGLGFIEVGARDGVHPMFQEIAPLFRLVGFEPDQEECHRLNSLSPGKPFRSQLYLPYGLGSGNGMRDFHLCRLRGTSSFYRPNRLWLNRFPDTGRFDIEQTQSVSVRSLDSLMRDPDLRMPETIDFIQIDTQGSELDVLHGAWEVVSDQVIGVQVEVEFSRIYESQPLFRDVDAFLSECGLTLFKLRRNAWVRRSCQDRPQVSAGQLIAGDALYLRDPLLFSARRSWNWSVHKVEALILMASLYDLNDFSLEILSDPQFSREIQTEEVEKYVRERGHRLDYQPNGNGLLQTGGTIVKELLKGKSGLGNLYAWTIRRSWGRSDSDKDFYTRTRVNV